MPSPTELLPVTTAANGRKTIRGWDRTEFPLAQEAVEYIRSTLASGKEIGGTFVPDSNGVLHRFTTTAFGHENDVQIPHGTFEWHTHPQRCGMTDCSLSSPSDTDVGIILDDVGTENISHIVFNHSGVFVMTLTPGLIVRLRKEGKRAGNAIKKRFTRLQDDFAVKYNKTRDEGSKDRAELWHQTEWMKLARVSGIHVDFFKYGEVPYVAVNARPR
eukprot:jgi/Mesvir1/23360/Mv21055-RA.1